jgi:hypothetical protein
MSDLSILAPPGEAPICRREERVEEGARCGAGRRAISASRAAALTVILLLGSACGGAGESSGDSGRAAEASSIPASVEAPSTAVETPTTSASATTPPPTTSPSASLAVFVGRYVGSTGGSGNAEIKDDGSGRFEIADLIACPSCSTASAPGASIDFKLTAPAPTGSGGYRVTGVITAASNPVVATAIGAGAVGSSFEATLSAAGGLTLSFLRPENVLLRTGGATVATSPATAARTDTGPDAFLSPSRNIGCRVSTTSVRCDIKERDWQAPPKPADCNLDWGFALGVSGQAAGQFRCAGDTASGGVTTVLPYGSVSRRGPLECRSQEVGMECIHLDTGHGIFLSRDGYKLS